MSEKNVFRSIVVLSLLLSVASGLYDFIFSSELIDTLWVVAYEADLGFQPEGISMQIVYAIILLLLVFSMVGLLLFKWWGRIAFLLCGLLGFPVIAMSGPQIYSGVSSVLYDLSNILSGVILVLIYYGPMSKYFKKIETSDK